MLPLILTTSVAAADGRLILVGDTGIDGPTSIASVLAQHLTDRMHEIPGARLAALGDLYYPKPPIDDAACADKVAARYRQFYDLPTAAHPEGFPEGAVVYAVAGNHDVAGPSDYSAAAASCTSAAFRQLGWVTGADGDRLATRSAPWPEIGAELMLVEQHDAYFDGAPASPASWTEPAATWRVALSHYPALTWTSKNDEEPPAAAGFPDHDLWLAGHAHVLQVFVGRAPHPVLALTSGAAPASYPFKRHRGTPPPRFNLSDRDDAAGMLILDFAGDVVRVTPVVCDPAGCHDERSFTFQRHPRLRGVREV